MNLCISLAPTVDDGKLIAAVSKHSFLYDTKDRDYRNLPMRVTAWSEIANDFNITDRKLLRRAKTNHEFII
jgi:Alcohol dehydrogenase transcription factor Myb/SANT-like